MVHARAHAQGHRGHARLHKRGHSASSSLASPLSPVADSGAFTFSRSDTPRTTTIEESWPETPHHTATAMSASTNNPLKIKPYLRKLSSKDANSLDLILDFVLTYVSVVFNYAGPFFLKRILDALDGKEPNPEKRAIAFIYAFLAFASSLAKAQADLQHLWIGRRACTRIRTELMAAIYDKALKRKDFSGIVDKDAKTAKPPGAKADPKADEPKAGADIGKIVNLMAGDANRCGMTVSAMYFIYGGVSAPQNLRPIS